MQSEKIRNILFCLPFCAGSIFYFDTNWIYFCFLIWLMMYAPNAIFNNSYTDVIIKTKTDFIPIIMIFIWFYGIIIGLINVDNKENVLRNYFGMSFYALYPIILYYWRDLDSIIKVIKKIAVVSSIVLGFICLYNFVVLLINEGGINSRILMMRDIGMVAIRLHYAANSIFLLSGAYIFLIQGKKLTSLPLIFLYILSFSKPFLFILAIFFLLLIKFNIFKKSYLLIIFTIFIFLVVNFLSMDDLINFYSGAQFSEGNLRSEQAQFLINDFTFFGHGLGAPLSNSDYTRDEAFNYGFELTYYNIYHKFGFYSLLIYFSFIYTIIKGFKLLFKKNANAKYIGALVIILMSYTLVGFGNPIIFNPICVVEHLFALALLRMDIYEA